IGITCATVVIAALSLLQRWLNARNMHLVRVLDHPELGQVSVYRKHWTARLQASELPYVCTLMGACDSGAPTEEQVSLWRAIRNRYQSLLGDAHQRLASLLNPADPVLRPELIELQTPDTFMFFLSRPFHSGSNPGRLFVRYRDM